MLQFGSITTGAATASKWEYTGGLPPGSIETIPSVTGIKNPLAFEPDFLLQQEAGVYGLDILGGFVINNATNSGVYGMARAGGVWLGINSQNDLVTGAYTYAVNDTTTFRREVGDALGNNMVEDLTASSYFITGNGISLFSIDRTGRIYTNQLIPAIAAPHHNFDLPIRDFSGAIVGYIKVYQP